MQEETKNYVIKTVLTDGEKILKNINDIMESLRHRFQDILQGKDAEK